MFLPPIDDDDMEEASPEENLQCPLRRGRDYSGHTFTMSEKRDIVQWMQQDNVTSAKFVEMWPSFSTRKIDKWKKLHKGGGAIHDSRKARPKLLDEQAYKEFDAGHDDKSDLRTLKVLFNKCASDTAIRSGKHNPGEFVVPSASCFKTYHKSCNSKAVLPQITTVARDREEKDPRNFFTWAILLLAYCVFLPAALVFNWDATTFSCGSDEHNRQKVYVKIAPRDVDDKKNPPAIVGGSLGMYIKKYFFHNSAGQVAPPVYVVADDSMEPNTYRAFRVNGLSSTKAAGDYGYLVFCQSRAGNDAFYFWYVTTVVLPFVAKVREHLGVAGRFPNGDMMSAFVSCDGEASQIRVLMRADVVELFRLAFVILGKTPRSCSGVTQASDISNGFKAEKKVMKTAQYRGYENPVLKDLLQECIGPIFNFSDELKKLLINSLLQLIYTAHCVINLHIVVHGYTEFGQQGGNIDFYKIMSACRGSITPRMRRLMFNASDHFVQIMRDRHQITEAEMDVAGIVNVNRPGTLPSEELTVSHKRAVVINGDSIIDENARHVERLNPVAIAARAQVARVSAASKALTKAQEDVRRGNEMDARNQAKMEEQAKKRQAKLDKLDENRKARAAKSAAADAERLLMLNMTASQKRAYRLQQAEHNLADLVAEEVGDEMEV
jgi:hypothetical protein